ncbi:type 2 lantibiotic [Butyrivibrio sp. XB500-5]|uniref:mersacidin family lantibiotic n=1 Tax=Butyrivibrio sp. XB500-5 TaxID=2364880 RepID=UPI000EAAC603|nr:lichenicidin A2 family type 2 lantibiotic [Butyrivibrio sp. XB500-5]RKM59700.1 type 2 lantibiotic [Butyrivibrio sp. XB500-5]
MAKDKLNKVVGNSFEDLKDDDMKKTQGAGDTNAETTPVVLSAIYGIPAVISIIASTNKD